MVPLIEKTAREILIHWFKLRAHRMTCEDYNTQVKDYLCRLDALRHISAIIAATAPHSVDKDNPSYLAGYEKFAERSAQAYDAAVARLKSKGATAIYPLPGTHPELLPIGLELARDAIDYTTEWESWLFIVKLSSAEVGRSDVQQALELLNASLSSLLSELALSPVSGELDALLHENWFDGSPSSLTIEACNSLWDVALLHTKRSLFEDVDALLCEVLRLKCASMMIDSIESGARPSIKDGRRMTASTLKSIKWYSATRPGNLASLEKATLDDLLSSKQGSVDIKKLAELRDAINRNKVAIAPVVVALDACLLLLSYMNAYEGDGIDKTKTAFDTVQVFAATAVTLKRILAHADLDLFERSMGPIGPVYSLMTGLLSFYAESQKENPNELVELQTVTQIVGSSLALVGRIAQTSALAGYPVRAVTSATLARLILLGDTIVAAGNIALTAGLVADAFWRLDAQLERHWRKNERVVGVLVGLMHALQTKEMPGKTRRLAHTHFGITSTLESLKGVLPDFSRGLLCDLLWGSGTLPFFGLPPIFDATLGERSPPGDFMNFKKRLRTAILKNTAFHGVITSKRAREARSRCHAILHLLGVESDDARDMFYWTEGQLESIESHPVQSWAFWLGSID
ncbi:MAG: hypothetical protein EPO40_03280 [Myxococcaceae bacterium]|nr:MAG: hypothetical protein EPO40_03280 [Myxococcaceae bacterium]